MANGVFKVGTLGAGKQAEPGHAPRLPAELLATHPYSHQVAHNSLLSYPFPRHPTFKQTQETRSRDLPAGDLRAKSQRRGAGLPPRSSRAKSNPHARTPHSRERRARAAALSCHVTSLAPPSRLRRPGRGRARRLTDSSREDRTLWPAPRLHRQPPSARSLCPSLTRRRAAVRGAPRPVPAGGRRAGVPGRRGSSPEGDSWSARGNGTGFSGTRA